MMPRSHLWDKPRILPLHGQFLPSHNMLRIKGLPPPPWKTACTGGRKLSLACRELSFSTTRMPTRQPCANLLTSFFTVLSTDHGLLITDHFPRLARRLL